MRKALFLKKRKLYSQKGQTLIEVLAALTVAVIIIAAIVSSAINSLSGAQFSRDQDLATQLSQQGIEIIRNMRNVSIASISAELLPDTTYCLAKGCTSLDPTIPSCWQKGSSCGQNVDKFVREVSVVHNSTDCNATPTPIGNPSSLPANVKFTVKTSWFDTKCTDTSNPFCHASVISSCFSDFTTSQTP